MIIAAVLYCYPVLQEKTLVQDDIVRHKAMAKELTDFKEATGEQTLWTTRLFGGMTTFNIGTVFSGDIMNYIDTIVRRWLPKTVNIMIIAMLGVYLLMLMLGVNPWLALVGAIGYGLSSNLLVSLLAGHNTKVLSIGYMAVAVAGTYLIYSKKKYSGAFIMALGSGLLLRANHVQIVYYFILISLIFGVVYLVDAVKRKALPEFTKTVGILVISGIIGVLPSAGKAYNVYEHSEETIRGGEKNLASANAQEGENTGGLDIDYAMRWSYGPLETMTTLVPSFMGGSTGEPLPENGEVAKALEKYKISKKQKDQILSRAPLYVGDQPFLLGTVYFGIGFIFLFVLAMFLVKGPVRHWALAIVALSLIISWGRHASFITEFFFEYLPLYNKFRTPSMALSMAGLIVPALGFLGLQRAFNNGDDSEFKVAFKWASIVTGGTMLLLLLYGLSTDWIGMKDNAFQTEGSPWALDDVYRALIEDRKGRFISDWFIGLVLLAITALSTLMLARKKWSVTLVSVILLVVIGGDMWRVSKRYLDSDDFQSTKNYDSQFAPTNVDKTLLRDQDPNFRVINLSVNPWTDAITSYHHKNVGGYHAAKLQRYQELIENELSTQLQKLQPNLQQQGNKIVVGPNGKQSIPVYNMLNTKYFILQPNQAGGFAANPYACGNAWFVSSIKEVESNREEMDALSNFDPLETAVVSNEFKEELFDYSFGKSPNSIINLTSFAPNKLTYTSENTENGLAVFSEVFYKKGWEATIDGKPAEIFRVNYLLRALKIPAGSHEIEMTFEPQSFYIGQGIAITGSILFILFTIGIVILSKKRKTEE